MTIAIGPHGATGPCPRSVAGGAHDVVYVVSENNTVYAIDAASGVILLQRNLGAPVPTPLGCGNIGPNVGITSTPVIDLARGEMYLIAYINGTTPSYQLHAINLLTLTDTLPPVTVAASQTLRWDDVYFQRDLSTPTPGTF